ncbi:hypothetical protein SODALDRAFT_379267 [Sodiomyces alkalinus F11]|uniref:Uncharacterized protein n=1 Tax=Sodiomyces alkalinus (strain CBS 110278 / VKM F-3762 / F11) TaxID=1314773 RepID=A0A3N2PU39_SODAK|nr:hypothetical protein SODALDRAFT_379267 [Sodiomyces alkalinus F11]ROT38038.1 hypothetical protein SODALDRAFT_379267 [Sodiomyces alkalinus F11]
MLFACGLLANSKDKHSMSLGSLTTAFDPAATGCLDPDIFWMESRGAEEALKLSMQQGVPYTQRPACYPRDYIPVSTSYYSPGVCPSNYTVACSSTLMEANTPVTAYVCCPAVYWQWSCPPDDPTSILRRSPWLTTLGCWSSLSETTVRVMTEAKIGSNEVITTTMSSGLLGAHAINVRFREGDFLMSRDLPVPMQADPTERASGTSRPPSAATHTSDTTTTTCRSAEEITPSMAAGIAVGSIAGALLLILLGWVLVRILKHRDNAKEARERANSAAAAAADAVERAKVKPELRGTEPHHIRVAELGPSERRMSWENTWEHITVSPSSPFTIEACHTPTTGWTPTVDMKRG